MNCDRIARWYRWMEYGVFGKELERRRLRFLAEAASAKRALVLGGGDGRFLAELVRARGAEVDDRSRRDRLTAPSPARFGSRRDGVTGGETIDYVDASAKMLELARGRAGSDCVAYHHADALTIPLPQDEYDLIVTHFFLDCFNDGDAARLVERVAQAARPSARWIVSEFRVPPDGWRETAGRLLVSGLYVFFRIATGLETRRLVNHHPLLAGQGFRLEQAEAGWSGLVASESWVRVY